MSLLTAGMTATVGYMIVQHKAIADVAKPYRDMIQKAAKAAGVSSAVLASLIWHESRYNPAAEGSAGEIGMCQMKKEALADVGLDVSDIVDDSKMQIIAGAQFLALQIKRAGDVYNGLRAYNVGAAGAARDVSAGAPYAVKIITTAVTDFLYNLLERGL